MPSVSSLDAFRAAIAEFAVADAGLVIEPTALASARRSLDDSGLLLLGEVHGVRENPLLIRALMQAFLLTSVALEWPEDLAPVIRAFLAGETLAEARAPSAAARSAAARARGGRRGSTPATTSSSWTCPWRPRRLCSNGTVPAPALASRLKKPASRMRR